MRGSANVALMVAVGLAASLLSHDLSAAPPAPAAGVLHPNLPVPVIPPDQVQIENRYPKIPPDVEAAANKREAEWKRLDREALARAMPEIEKWDKMGRPYIKVARQPSDLPQATIPAFPGAEGGGMWTFGGRGGKVMIVTSLADDGPGTLREAVQAGGPRIVVFNVAGIIHLERPLVVLSPYLSIEGQTAPGDGICIAGRTTHVETHDVVIRYMRFRRGITEVTDRDDALSGDAIGNVIFDHCSASWGLDETLSIYRQSYYPDPTTRAGRQNFATMNVTVQWCIITEALDTYNHSFGATWGGKNNAFHHNLFADNAGRNASIGSTNDFNWVNNVIFNWRHRTLDGGGMSSTVNVINNYYKPGPATNPDELQYRIAKPEHGGGKYFVSGNFMYGNEKVSANNWDGGIQYGPDAGTTSQPAETKEAFLARVHVNNAFPIPYVSIQTAAEAYETVLADAGANLPVRDSVDQRAVRQTRTGEVDYKKGKGIVNDISEVGGYPDYKGTPVVYTQKDGIPDWWKTKYGLDIHDADLASKDTDGDGYTTIEEYLNGSDPTKLPYFQPSYKNLSNNRNPLSTDGPKLLFNK